MSIGPQIGPAYKKLDGKNELRTFAYWADGKRQDPKVAMGAANVKELDKNLTWAAITGKYFTAIVNPLLSVPYRTAFDSRRTIQGFDRSVIAIARPVQKANAWTDKYRVYLGPMKKDILARYNSAEKNALRRADLHADEAVTSSALIGWLANLLKWVLEFFYMLIPNYGVAIILLTLFTKIIFLPLTFKSSESTAKMAALNPKMQEIRARLKDKPEKMNQEIAALYKKEKVNPLSGCLPLLLQLPIFFALYNLLNTPLRAARRAVHPRLDPRPVGPRVRAGLRLLDPAGQLDEPAAAAPHHAGHAAPVEQDHAAAGALTSSGRPGR